MQVQSFLARLFFLDTGVIEDVPIFSFRVLALTLSFEFAFGWLFDELQQSLDQCPFSLRICSILGCCISRRVAVAGSVASEVSNSLCLCLRVRLYTSETCVAVTFALGSFLALPLPQLKLDVSLGRLCGHFQYSTTV